jgi:tetratricopeptide (TPR) repeat protein/transcriptional regulator with XRE-family HTH domain
VANPPAVPFAGLLRQMRLDAGMTQEQLAAAARLSPRSISDLERGINLSPRQETARLLADALGLVGPARSAFEAAARRRAAGDGRPDEGRPGAGVAAATRTLPRDIGSFTGRSAELRQLVGAVAQAVRSGGVVGIYAIGGMAGIGKTAFAVHAAHQLADQFPDGQIFLPLHGHTPGQRPVDPADALASLLQTAGAPADQIPPGLDARTRLWRDYLVGRRLLLLLDDAAGHDQVRPLLPGIVGCLVLVTSRRHLTALEDAEAVSLDTLPPGEAAELLIRVAARPGLDPAASEIGEITRLCGYLPLAVGMLARQLHHHPTWTPAELVGDLAATRDRLELMRAENLSVAAALDLSYQDLTIGQQQLFRRLGLHLGTDIDAYAAAALDQSDLATARRRLDALYDQYLLAEPAHGRYRFHDLVAERARTLVAGDPAADQAASADRLLGYYLHCAQAADRQLARRSPAGMPSAMSPPPVYIPGLANRPEAVAWMTTERFNLHAVAVAIAHDQMPQAVAIAAAMHGFLRSQGHWSQALTLYAAMVEAARHAGHQLAEAGALTDLGDMQTLTGDYRSATGTHEAALSLYRDHSDPLGEANALNRLGTVQQATGDFRAATASLTRALELHRTALDRLGEANDHNQLGIMQFETDHYPAAAACHERALRLCRLLGDPLGEANALNRLGRVQYVTGDYGAATASLTGALRLHRDLGYRFGEATVLSQLGRVQQVTGQMQAAAATQQQALDLYRDLGYPRGEADALSGLGAVRQATGDAHGARAYYRQALELYHTIGFPLGEAEVRNGLGEVALAFDGPAAAHAHYQDALAIARDIASRLEEARAQEGIGRCALAGDLPAKADVPLQAALIIYNDIGSPHAERVRTLLRTRNTTQDGPDRT